MNGRVLRLIALLAVSSVPAIPQTAPPPGTIQLRIDRDVEYARVGNRSLKLDLYLRQCATAPCTDIPSSTEPAPVVVWAHGGDGSAGDKFPSPAARLVADGYVVASIEYRLTGEAKFPAQIYDCKAAIRWLRSNAVTYNLDARHIGVWGEASGGQLVSLLGTSGDVKELEGAEGNSDQSSRVQAVVDFYGPADLVTPGPSAEAASPIPHISADDPPFLIVHGTADKIVSPRQSESFVTALKHAGVDANLEYVMGAEHDFKQVQTPAIMEMVARFFDRHLRGGKRTRDDANYIREPPDCWEDPFTDEIGGLPYKTYPTPSRGPKLRASYRLYLPPDYAINQNRRYPVIYWLHGAGDDSRSAITHMWVSRLDAAIRNGIAPPAIAIVVQSPNSSHYVDSKDGRIPAETVIVKDLIAHVDSTYRSIASRDGRAIDGHSMGGEGSLQIGFKYPQLFGTVSSVAAAVNDRTHPPPELREQAAEVLRAVYGGDVEYYEASTAWALAERNQDKIRGRTNIRMIYGEKDRPGIIASNQRLHEVLTRLNIPHQFVMSKGSVHTPREQLSRLDSNPFEFYAKAFAHAK